MCRITLAWIIPALRVETEEKLNILVYISIAHLLQSLSQLLPPLRMFQSNTYLRGKNLEIRQDTNPRAVSETIDRISGTRFYSFLTTYIRIKPPFSTPVIEYRCWNEKD